MKREKEKEWFATIGVVAFIGMFYVGGLFEEGRIGAINFLFRMTLLFGAMIYSAYRAEAFIWQQGGKK
jgi:hypothetical protein